MGYMRRVLVGFGLLAAISCGQSVTAQSDLDRILRFESGTFEGWEVINPATWKVEWHPDYMTQAGDPECYVAHSLASGEEAVGTIRSIHFTIQKAIQAFLVAGADGTATTTNSGDLNFIYLRSYPDGAILRTAKPPGYHKLASARWLTNDLIGREVYLEVVDNNPRLNPGGYAWMALANYHQEDLAGDFAGTYLPLLSIETLGNPIPSTGKSDAHLIVIEDPSGGLNNLNSPFVNVQGPIGIELRGNYSASFPKRQYSFEFRDSSGEDLKVEMLDFPDESDWVLHGPYVDKSLIRNHLAYSLSNLIGRYAPRTRLVEVFVDYDYQGAYTLTEKIKRGRDRVAISKLTETDITEPAITGGYILEFTPLGKVKPEDTYFTTNRGHVLIQNYPKGDDITPEQQAYIKQYMNDFENALYGSNFTDPIEGYRKYLDMDSAVDFLILTEMTKNVDSFNSSTFVHKDRLGKLMMGPIWDYDLAFGNCECWGYQYTDGYANVPGSDGWTYWAPELLNDPEFRQRYNERWKGLRAGVYSDASLTGLIDSSVAELDGAIQRNFVKWPILGQYIWPNMPPIPTTYEGEVNRLKTWLQARVNWLDANPLPVPTVNPPVEDPDNWSFEDESFTNWEVSGTAWGSAPVINSPNTSTPSHGQRFADTSHSGEAAVGVLTSKTFTLKHKKIQFDMAGWVSLHLYVRVYSASDDHIIATAYMSKTSPDWSTRTLDVSSAVGDEVYLKVVDDDTRVYPPTGGWMAVDHFNFLEPIQTSTSKVEDWALYE